ncbi:choice-of-anchor A family protein [Stigmatella sp. ncwal1]|uniref:Choice-of-anchor A family protein n=1 Tax=Stigmatella ashevillensis TaxID=2995309 RepID=A0ABT5D366_9BACT|nr:choice-of-anchor A family protein [Stigmatella ashevillena]MDC0708120.1 choice-of-anchor A family protein [Stigmatella ashevillena]
MHRHKKRTLFYLALVPCAALAGCLFKTEEEKTVNRGGEMRTADRCEVIPPFTGNFDPELEWAWSGSPILPSHNQVMMTPVVVEVNGDGIPDVVFNTFAGGQYTDNGVLRAISGNDGHDLWAVTDPALRVNPGANIAAGDIDNDGLVEICTEGQSPGKLLCFENTGAFKFQAVSSFPNNTYGAPSLADLNGDGRVEILHSSDVFDSQGNRLWASGAAAPLPFAADIDQDGVQEVIIGGSVYFANGTLKCTGTAPASFSAVGNFDSDPRGEIVLVGNGVVSVMDDNCATLWSTLILGKGGGPPNVADFDNDGQPEIGIAGRSFYSVFETNGGIKWSSPTQDFSSQVTGSSTFDFEGDGRSEVIYGDEVRLRIYDGATGAIRFDVPHASATIYENPVIVDVDGDNNAEIVMPANNFYFPGPTGIRVFRDKRDGWVNTRRIWNQHAYAVTNVNEDGTIPAHPATNWLTPGLNTFRSNSQGSGTTSPFAAADLVASEVVASCDSATEQLTLSASVRNQGDAAASSGLKVSFFRGNPTQGGTLLGVATIANVLPAQGSAIATITLNPAPGGLAEVFVVADNDGTGTGREQECREDNNTASAQVSLACSRCAEVRLNDANLFLLEDYTGGHDVQGKVAAGGNIDMTDFAVGAGLPDTQTSNTLVAGGNLTLSRGGVWGDAWYGGNYSADTAVVYSRGAVTQGTPIYFAARFGELRRLSSQLAALTANGTTTREPWGGIMLHGTDLDVNVFDVSASAFNGAALWSIDAPADSLVVVNIRGGSASFSGFSTTFSGGIDQHGVLYHFVDATSITAQGFGFWGTVLAPYAHVNFSNGSWDGGIYALSLTGNAEGHVNPLNDRDICE